MKCSLVGLIQKILRSRGRISDFDKFGLEDFLKNFKLARAVWKSKDQKTVDEFFTIYVD